MSPKQDVHAGGQLDEMDYDECLALLRSQEIGRVAVMIGYYPQVFCVNYRLDGDTVVFRTEAGSPLAEAAHANVGFEVDVIDYRKRTGRTVLVCGMAEDVTDRRPGDPVAERARSLGVEPWAAGDRNRFIRIIRASMSGRHLHPPQLTWPSDSRGYL